MVRKDGTFRINRIFRRYAIAYADKCAYRFRMDQQEAVAEIEREAQRFASGMEFTPVPSGGGS